MNRQNRYHANLRDFRTDQIDVFLTTDENFIKRYRAFNFCQLIILGDMNSENIVATTFLIDELSRKNEYQLFQSKICYYYCQNDETDQIVHIFFALILAFFEQLCELKKTFYE